MTDVTHSGDTTARALREGPLLRGAEWMAENAYIAPGFHRLLSAGGLTLGLWGGRKIMDVVTARRSSNEQEFTREETPEILRPLHGLMRYNPYSDDAADRWKYVADRFAPLGFGSLGAFMGSKLFFHGKRPDNRPFFPVGAQAKVAVQAGDISTEAAEVLSRLSQSDATRKWAMTTFMEGSAMGMHLPGALSPFNNGMVAVTFQQGAGRNIHFPFLGPINRWLGNHGASSRYLFSAMRDTATWMHANILKFANADQWLNDSALMNRVRDGLQKFPQRTAEEETRVAQAYRSLIEEAYRRKHEVMRQNPGLSAEKIAKEVYDALSGAHNSKRGLLGQAHDWLLHDAGIALDRLHMSPDPFTTFSRIFGSAKREVAIIERYGQYLRDTFGYAINPAEWAKAQTTLPRWKRIAAYGGGAAAITTALVGALVVGSQLERSARSTRNPHHPDNTQASEPPSESEVPASRNKGLLGWINGVPLDAAHWLGRVVLTPPSMHRFMNAAYLSGVLLFGLSVANTLTGRRLNKLNSGFNALGEEISVIRREQIFAPFRPLHGLLAYTPGSAAWQDRWRQVAHYLMPVGMGMFGTYTGSAMFFRDRTRALATPQTLEEYSDRISLEQSKPFAWATAITSIFNTGSGIHLLPIFNYSSNLHNRYLLGSGNQVAMPGVGKWWSGNPGLTPWGIASTLRHLSQYLTYNTAARPHETPTLVHSVLAKLYPALDEHSLLDKKQILLDRIYAIRDSYLEHGVLPAHAQLRVGEVMQQLLSGVGFEQLLREAALDPAKADLMNNGASGAIANTLGAGVHVARLAGEYRNAAADRATTQRDPKLFLQSLLNKTPANDGRLNPSRPISYAERIRSEAGSPMSLTQPSAA